MGPHIKLSKMDKKIILCSFNSPDHQIFFQSLDLDDQTPLIFMRTHLVNRSIWRRIKYAIKYVLGYKSIHGAWDEFYLGAEHSDDFKKIYQYLDKGKEKVSSWKRFNPEVQGTYLTRGADCFIQIAYFNGLDWIQLWGSRKLEIKEWAEIPE